MNEIQKTALAFWLEGVSFENDFKPHSDQRTSDYMKSIGHTVSKTGIYKWRVKYGWEKELEFRVKQLCSEDARVKASLGEAIKDEAVQKTIVDLARNKELMGRGYEILELKCKLIMENYRITKKISEADTKLAIMITQLAANREDRMLDRRVVAESLGRAEALKAIAAVAGEITFEGEGEFEAHHFEGGDVMEAVIVDKDEFEDEDE